MKKEKLIKNIIWSSLILVIIFGIALLIDVMSEDNGLGGLFFASLFWYGYWTFSIVSSSLYVWFLIFNMRNLTLILHPIATFLGVSDIFSFIIGIVIMYPGPESIGAIICLAATLVLGSFILYKQFKSTSSI
jgi:small-conductance mechanosensitive channel